MRRLATGSVALWPRKAFNGLFSYRLDPRLNLVEVALLNLLQSGSSVFSGSVDGGVDGPSAAVSSTWRTTKVPSMEAERDAVLNAEQTKVSGPAVGVAGCLWRWPEFASGALGHLIRGFIDVTNGQGGRSSRMALTSAQYEARANRLRPRKMGETVEQLVQISRPRS